MCSRFLAVFGVRALHVESVPVGKLRHGKHAHPRAESSARNSYVDSLYSKGFSLRYIHVVRLNGADTGDGRETRNSAAAWCIPLYADTGGERRRETVSSE